MTNMEYIFFVINHPMLPIQNKYTIEIVIIFLATGVCSVIHCPNSFSDSYFFNTTKDSLAPRDQAVSDIANTKDKTSRTNGTSTVFISVLQGRQPCMVLVLFQTERQQWCCFQWRETFETVICVVCSHRVSWKLHTYCSVCTSDYYHSEMGWRDRQMLTVRLVSMKL
jgi:hypothetical protein